MKLSELASRRADWLSSMTIGHQQQQQQRKSCPSLETVIGGIEADKRGTAMEQSSSLQRSASSSCLSSPIESMADVSVYAANCVTVSLYVFNMTVKLCSVILFSCSL